MTYAIIAQQSQAPFCDNSLCPPFFRGAQWGMDSSDIKTRLEALGLSQSDLARAIGITPDKVNKVFAGTRQWKADELQKVYRVLADLEARGGYGLEPDLPEVDGSQSYLPVEVLPSFAGMGGGGNGDGDIEHALISRRMIEDELHAKPSDLLLLEARGESMMPDFLHGDQILIDKRDRNPIQPGAFALWDGDGYVVKLVERVPRERGRYRVFSANDRFSAYEVDEDEITIMGRPVWFGRRL